MAAPNYVIKQIPYSYTEVLVCFLAIIRSQQISSLNDDDHVTQVLSTTDYGRFCSHYVP